MHKDYYALYDVRQSSLDGVSENLDLMLSLANEVDQKLMHLSMPEYHNYISFELLDALQEIKDYASQEHARIARIFSGTIQQEQREPVLEEEVTFSPTRG